MKKGTSLYLDLIRFSAAFVVFFEHFRERTTLGFHSFWKLYPSWFAYIPALADTAVIVFFVLSGYVIAHVLATRERTPFEYFASRFSRLYSVVVPALILTASTNYLERIKYPHLFDHALISVSGITPAFYYLASTVFVSHFWLWPDLEPPNIPIWSLSFESAFYVGIALAVFSKGSVRILGLLLLCLAAGPTIVLLAPTWILGYWAYHFSQHQKFPAGATIVVWLASILLVLICPLIETRLHEHISLLRIPNPSLGHVLASYASAICFTVNLLAFNGFSDRVESFFLPFASIIRWLGSITFALYLFHGPILSFFTIYSLPDRSSIAQLFLLVGSTFLVVATLGRFCEQSKSIYKRCFQSMWRRVATAVVE